MAQLNQSDVQNKRNADSVANSTIELALKLGNVSKEDAQKFSEIADPTKRIEAVSFLVNKNSDAVSANSIIDRGLMFKNITPEEADKFRKISDATERYKALGELIEMNADSVLKSPKYPPKP